MHLSFFAKELRGLFSSTVFYGVVAFFFSLQGALLYVLPEYNILDTGFAELKNFFEISPYIFALILPALTMGLFSDERRSGTIVDLICSQLTIFQIVFYKFLATFVVGTLLVICSLVYFAILWYCASPVGNIDASSVLCSYLGLELLMLTMCAISVAGAAFSKNQIISLLFSTLSCFFAYSGLESLKLLFSWTSMASILMQASLKFHFLSMSKGVIDSRDLVYFFVIIVLALIFSSIFLKKMVKNGTI